MDFILDFAIDDIKQWYDDEVEGYANLGSKDKEKYKYPYFTPNQLMFIWTGLCYPIKKIKVRNA